MIKTICVYSSSSGAIDKEYFVIARELGNKIASNGYTMIFGAGDVGLMGECARGAKEKKGKVVGVIPEALNAKKIVFKDCDEIIVTSGMRERKAVMDEKSDAFITMPGGYGTLEELLEIITLKQLKYHEKPIIILNVKGYYDDLIKIFEKIIREKFAKQQCENLYYITSEVDDALKYIEEYTPVETEDKWF